MRILAHLSDLHFGRVDAAILEPLRKAVWRLEPHAVVISGDLTQRAKPREFREARAFLDTLPRPQIVVPGNHDVPLYNVFKRFLAPLDAYRRHISEELEPVHIDGEIAIVGVNTARSLTFKGGRISEEQVERIRAKLCTLDERIAKIVVTHHPFELPDTMDPDHIVGRARMAMRTLAGCGADILLAGHAHASHVGDTAARYKFDGYAALVVQAGTATSTRARGEMNSFNSLRVDGPEIRVDRYTWSPQAGIFELSRSEGYAHTARGWVRAGAQV